MIRRLLFLGLLTQALLACGPEPAERPAPVARLEGDRLVMTNPATAGAIRTEAVVADAGGSRQLAGRLVWNETRTARIFPQVAGRVREISVDVGETVRAGQRLARLESPDYGVALAELQKGEADLKLAGQALRRGAELREAGILAERDWQQLEAEAQRSRAEAARARQRVAGLGGGSEQGYAIRAPLAGIVVERHINPGTEYRVEGDGAPLFVITDPRSLWLQLEASEADLAFLRPGEPVQVAVRQYPGETFRGEVLHVADFVDPQTRTVHVRCALANADRRLKAEMFAQVRVEIPPRDVLLVPQAALMLQGTALQVLVAEGESAFRRRAVQIGEEREGLVEVVAGLKAGERVVVEGNLHLLRYFKPVAESAR